MTSHTANSQGAFLLAYRSPRSRFSREDTTTIVKLEPTKKNHAWLAAMATVGIIAFIAVTGLLLR